MELARAIYAATASFPKDEIFGLRAQLRRAAVSVPSNIAEGHGRLSDRSLRVFLSQARGSLFEIETQVMLSSDFGFLAKSEAAALLEQCGHVARLINGLLRSLASASAGQAPAPDAENENGSGSLER